MLSPIDFGSDTFFEGDLAQTNCVLRKGDRPVVFSWLFDGHLLTSSQDVEIVSVGGRTSLLTLDPVRGHHQGNYTCRASNGAGSSDVSSAILVNGTKIKLDLQIY